MDLNFSPDTWIGLFFFALVIAFVVVILIYSDKKISWSPKKIVLDSDTSKNKKSNCINCKKRTKNEKK